MHIKPTWERAILTLDMNIGPVDVLIILQYITGCSQYNILKPVLIIAYQQETFKPYLG